MDAPHRAAAATPGAGIVDIAMRGYERRTRSRYPFYKLQKRAFGKRKLQHRTHEAMRPDCAMTSHPALGSGQSLLTAASASVGPYEFPVGPVSPSPSSM